MAASGPEQPLITNVLRMTDCNLEHETVLTLLPLIASIHSCDYVFTVLVFS